MDGRGVSLFALALSFCLCGCIPKQLTVPVDQKQILDEKPEAPESRNLNPFAAKPKREPKLELDFAIYCEQKALGLKDSPEKQHRELDEARKMYQEILNYDDKYVEAYRGLGRVYIIQRDFARAAAIYQKALELHPKNAQLYDDMSVVHSMKGDSATAMKWIARALELDPENRDFMKRMAVNLVQAGQIDRGVDMMARARGRAAGHYYVARTLVRMNRPDEARQHVQLALQFNPTYAEARTLLANLEQPRQPNAPPNVGLQFVSDD